MEYVTTVSGPAVAVEQLLQILVAFESVPIVLHALQNTRSNSLHDLDILCKRWINRGTYVLECFGLVTAATRQAVSRTHAVGRYCRASAELG